MPSPDSLGKPNPARATLKDFGFIGAGSSEPPPDGPVSVRHDEFLDDAIVARVRKR